MNARRSIHVGRTAAGQIAETAAWWRSNRLAAPTLFLDELDCAYELIRHEPNVGQVVLGAKSERIRRVHLRRSRYHLFYQESEDGAAVEILAFWHTSRGSVPDL